MVPIKYWFKPLTGCLFTHQSEWVEKNIVTEGGNIPVILCNYCKRLFKYPTRQTDEPIYRK